MNDIEILTDLFMRVYGDEPTGVVPLPGAGSNRKYFRLSGTADITCIGVVGDDLRECRAFVHLSEDFSAAGVDVPRVLAHTDDCRCYLQTDLGSTPLFGMLHSAEGEWLVERAMRSLAALHALPAEVWEGAVEYAPFGRRLVMWDLNYFKYDMLKPAGVIYDESGLEDDMERLAADLTDGDVVTGFMYRDCQSRNVMLHDDRLWWIDFQGGRRGPVLYDAVSFLWQAKAGFDDDFRRRMVALYADTYCDMTGVSRERFLAPLQAIVLLRVLQTLGAYGFRGLIERKAHFIESIRGGLENLRRLIESGGVDRYPYMREACRALIECERFATLFDSDTERGGLTIKVFSFSYKKGYPEDLTGNGGGFMFDCRGMHNPGRYDEYKRLTGRDRPVIEFLQKCGEADGFADRAVELVAPSIEAYMRRGFSSLQIGFGCTGGQHRSVYCAERAGRAIAERYPEARVVLIHREQGVTEVISTKYE